MAIDWFQLINWIAQAFITFVFGCLGAFVGYQLSDKLERRKEGRGRELKRREEEKEGDRQLREYLQGGKIPVADTHRAARLAQDEWLPGPEPEPDMVTATSLARSSFKFFCGLGCWMMPLGLLGVSIFLAIRVWKERTLNYTVFPFLVGMLLFFGLVGLFWVQGWIKRRIRQQ